MKISDTVIISVLTTLSTGVIGLLIYVIRNWFINKTKDKIEKSQNKRESLQKLLEMHSEIIQDKQFDENWMERFFDMSKNILLWSSDNILAEYALYFQTKFPDFKIDEYEIHFAKAILAFRKEIGYKNKQDKITPEQIVLIFRSGFKRYI